jgi:glutamine amidotransferase
MLDIGIVDYGAGNIASVMKAVDYAGANPVLVATPEEILECDKLILPGVGASGLAIEKLREKHLDQALHEAVRVKAAPFLGICVGMQLLADDMYEFGHHKGLGWVPGKVISLTEYGISSNPVPHMGWNDVEFRADLHGLPSRLGNYKAFYFAHSFTLVTDRKDLVSASVKYEQQLVAGLLFETVSGFQFHPEKSQVAGDILMKWFIDWKP